MKRSIGIVALLALWLTACGPQATPTIDPAQVQASAVALANAILTQTQAAIPPTPVPSDTPEPSPTLEPSPTPSLIPTSGTPLATETSSSASADPCNGPLDAHSAGTGKNNNGSTGNVLISNGTKVSITVSLYLAKNKLGQCGYLSYVLAPMNSTFLANVLPYGCYYTSAYINDPKKPSRVSTGPDCITGPDKTTIQVTANGIRVIGP